MAVEMAESNVWFDKWRYDEAEKVYHESANKCLDECNCEVENEIIEPSAVSEEPSKKAEDAGLGPSLASQIAKARQEIQNISISCSSNKGGKGLDGVVNSDLLNRITKLEIVNNKLTTTVSTLEQTIIDLTKRLSSLECSRTTTAPAAKPAAKQVEEEEDDDDDVDLFGSDDEEEDAEAARVREERLKAYAEKKSKKPGPIAKSSVLLACKPWDDETDMKVMETEIRKIEMDGLTWGASKLVPLAYGIMKLTLLCIVEDEKVSIDDLTEKICEMEDYVQSVDIDAFNKI